ncbi:MAG: M56 family metallopeptidase, partial [Bacteroidota bacterium]
ETFFGLHRWLLLSGIALSFCLPLVEVPADYSIRDRLIPQEERSALSFAEKKVTQEVSTVSDALITQVSESTPSSEVSSSAIESADLIPQETERLSNTSPQSQPDFLTSLTLPRVAMWLYLAGFVILLSYLIYQILSLARLRRHGNISQQGRYTIVEHDVCDQSFSFGRTIYVHAGADAQLDRDHIIRHEKIHARQLHSVDILLSECLTIVLWFNPFAWMYKRAIRDNLEYITDRQMIDEGADTKAYQMSLVRITVPHTLSQLRQPTAAVALANNYNHSTLKQRIIMMNKKYSSYYKIWKTLLLAPLLGLAISGINNVVAEQSLQALPTTQQVQTKQVVQERVPIAETELAVIADPQPTTMPEAQLQPQPSVMSKADPESTTVIDRQVDIIEEDALESPIKGHWELEDDLGMTCLYIYVRRKRYFSNWSDCDINVSSIPQGEFEEHSITRASGTLKLSGERTGDEGSGRFTFVPDESFREYLTSSGYKNVKDVSLMHMFQTNIDKEYLAYFEREGFRLDTDELLGLAVHGVDIDELTDKVNALKKRNIKSTDAEDLIAMAIHGIDSEYMDEIDGMGYNGSRIEHYVQMRIHDVSPDFVIALQEAGFTDLDSDEVVQMAIHDVSDSYITELASVGLQNLDVDEIVQMAIHDVDASFVESIKELKLAEFDFDEIIQMAIHDIDVDYIESLADVGYELESIDEIVEFAIHDIDPSFIASVRDLGLTDLSRAEIVQAAIHDIDANQIKDLQSIGLEEFDFQDLVAFSIHGVDSRYVKRLQDAGIRDILGDSMEIRDLIQASIHDIDADFIKEVKADGFENLSIGELVELKIHDRQRQAIRRRSKKQ